MTKRLTRDDVLHVARLARLHLNEDEIDRFCGQLSAVLDHAAALSGRDLSDVPPTSHALEFANVWRDDVVRPGCDRGEVLQAAPAQEAGRFKVPSILGEAP